MKKSIIGVLGLSIVLSLIFGGRFLVKEGTADDHGQTVSMANNKTDADVIIIEEDEVPLAAAIPLQEDEASDEEVSEKDLSETELPQETATPEMISQAITAAETEKPQEDSGVLSCLIDGNHCGVWTDCGDYKVMKCADCAQEISERAYKLADGVYGYYNDASAMLLFSEVNHGRPGFELDGTLHEVARERALDCAGDFSHDDMRTSGECIAKGQADASAAIAAWNASDYHRNLLINPMYTEGGSSCLWYDAGNGNMESIWVMVLD